MQKIKKHSNEILSVTIEIAVIFHTHHSINISWVLATLENYDNKYIFSSGIESLSENYKKLSIHKFAAHFEGG